MKKWLAALLCLTLIVTLIGGCAPAKPTEPETPDQTETPEDPETPETPADRAKVNFAVL